MAIAPLLETSRVQATADLLQMLGWSQVGNVNTRDNITVCMVVTHLGDANVTTYFLVMSSLGCGSD